MKLTKKYLEKLIVEELDKSLNGISESVRRMTPADVHPKEAAQFRAITGGYIGLKEVQELCKDAMDPAAVGVRGQVALDKPTKQSFRRIYDLAYRSLEKIYDSLEGQPEVKAKFAKLGFRLTPPKYEDIG